MPRTLSGNSDVRLVTFRAPPLGVSWPIVRGRMVWLVTKCQSFKKTLADEDVKNCKLVKQQKLRTVLKCGDKERAGECVPRQISRHHFFSGCPARIWRLIPRHTSFRAMCLTVSHIRWSKPVAGHKTKTVSNGSLLNTDVWVWDVETHPQGVKTTQWYQQQNTLPLHASREKPFSGSPFELL